MAENRVFACLGGGRVCPQTGDGKGPVSHSYWGSYIFNMAYCQTCNILGYPDLRFPPQAAAASITPGIRIPVLLYPLG